MINFSQRERIESLFECIVQGDLSKSLVELDRLDDLSFFPPEYRKAIAKGLEKNDWTDVGEWYATGNFIGDGGYFIMIAPYSRRRSGFRENVVSGVLGLITLDIDINDVEAEIVKVFGKKGHPFSQVLGFRAFSSFGLVGGEKGEAFLVPTSWQVPKALDGPALNDMTEQSIRLRQGVAGIRSLFTRNAQSIILPTVLDSIRSASTRNLEYQYHDAGHATGVGIKEKMRTKWFTSPRNCGIEEWRSDGVMFRLASACLSRERFASLIASNIALRFGVDVHRSGGVESDPDVLCSTLLLDDLLESKLVEIVDGNFNLLIKDWLDLPGAIEPMMRRTVSYTKDEYNATSLESVYKDLTPSTEAIHIVDNVIRPHGVAMGYMA